MEALDLSTTFMFRAVERVIAVRQKINARAEEEGRQKISYNDLIVKAAARVLTALKPIPNAIRAGSRTSVRHNDCPAARSAIK